MMQYELIVDGLITGKISISIKYKHVMGHSWAE